MPLSNNTISDKIDEIGQDVESELIDVINSRTFSLQMDESSIRDREALLLTYVRHSDHDKFQERKYSNIYTSARELLNVVLVHLVVCSKTLETGLRLQHVAIYD